MIYRMGTYAQKTVSGVTTLIPDDGTTAWTNVVGMVTTSLGKIIRSTTSPNSWYTNSGCFGFLPSGTDGYLEFTLTSIVGQEYNVAGIFGLSTSPVNRYKQINYGFNAQNHGGTIGTSDLYIRETNSNPIGNFSTWNYSDIFRIERIGSVVYYKIDRGIGFVTVYTSTVSSSGDLYFSCDINKNSGAENLKIVY